MIINYLQDFQFDVSNLCPSADTLFKFQRRLNVCREIQDNIHLK